MVTALAHSLLDAVPDTHPPVPLYVQCVIHLKFFEKAEKLVNPAVSYFTGRNLFEIDAQAVIFLNDF